jgi:Ni/Fe-hydrogenase subunit HybB-like protein
MKMALITVLANGTVEAKIYLFVKIVSRGAKRRGNARKLEEQKATTIIAAIAVAAIAIAAAADSTSGKSPCCVPVKRDWPS